MSRVTQNRKSNPIKTSWLIAALIIVVLLFGALEFLDFNKWTPQDKQTLIEMDTTGIYEIDFHGEEGFYRITKDLDEVWKLNDSITINQEVVGKYLTQFDKIATKNYNNTFDVSTISVNKTYYMIVKSADEPKDLKINCFKIDSPSIPYILQSNQNPDYFFKSGLDGLKTQLFWNKDQFQ